MPEEGPPPLQVHQLPRPAGPSTLEWELPGSCGQGRGGRWSLLFLGHVSPASCPGALPRHYSATATARSWGLLPRLWGGSRLSLSALCSWPPRTQNMADGAQANPKEFRKKGLVRQPSGWRGPSLRASSPLRNSRYMPASLGWSPPWRGAGMRVGNGLLESISSESRALSL